MLGYWTLNVILEEFAYSTSNWSAPTYLIYIEIFLYETVNFAPKDFLPSFCSERKALAACIYSGLYRTVISTQGWHNLRGPQNHGATSASSKQSAAVPSGAKPLHSSAGGTTPNWNTKRFSGFLQRGFGL